MEDNERILCRVAACRERMSDGNDWSFYLINDSEFTFDALLEEISYEWGDIPTSQKPDVCFANLRPNAQALIWRNDGELRLDLLLLIRLSDRQERLRFEFPKLYRKHDRSFFIVIWHFLRKMIGFGKFPLEPIAQ